MTIDPKNLPDDEFWRAMGLVPSKRYDADCRRLTPGQQAILDAIPLRCNVFDQMANDLADSTPKILAALDRLAANGMPFASAASTSTVSTTPPSTLTLEKIEAMLADIPPEPIGEWMRKQGFPPEASVLFLPETMRGQLPIWPSYVSFSPDVAAPTLCMNVLHDEWQIARYRK